MIDFESAYATILASSGSGSGSGDHSSVGTTMMDGKNSVIVDDIWNQSLSSCSPHPPSRLLIIIKWIGKVISATYLSQPWILAILPLCIGIILGTILATTTNTTTRKRPTNHSTTKYISKNPFQPPPSSSSSSTQDEEEEDKNIVYQTPSSQEEEQDQIIRNTLSLKPHNNNKKKKTASCRHLAVIMDGNRRYGKLKYGNATRGHSDGSRRLIEFIAWCMDEQIQELTVYAFSTENWSRSPQEVQALMDLLYHYMDELRIKAMERGIQINVLSTDTSKVSQTTQKKNIHLSFLYNCLYYMYHFYA